jgi:hypothetical protein
MYTLGEWDAGVPKTVGSSCSTVLSPFRLNDEIDLDTSSPRKSFQLIFGANPAGDWRIERDGVSF